MVLFAVLLYVDAMEGGSYTLFPVDGEKFYFVRGGASEVSMRWLQNPRSASASALGLS